MVYNRAFYLLVLAAVIGAARGSKVVQLTQGTFSKKVLNSKDTWIVAFTAPWCGHCQRLQPEFDSASVSADGQIKFGQVDATAEQSLASEYNVKGYPTIKIFRNGDVSDYELGRTESDFVQFAEEEFLKNLPPPVASELTSQDVFDSECASRPKCFIVFLPTLEESGKDTRDAYIGVLQEVADRFQKSPFSWKWVAAHQQPDLESSLKISSYPSVVALNGKKSKYSDFHGAFTNTAIGKFVNKLQAGRQAANSLKILPDIVTTTPWDGEDFVPEVYEEEFDLADLMGDDDEDTRDEL